MLTYNCLKVLSIILAVSIHTFTLSKASVHKGLSQGQVRSYVEHVAGTLFLTSNASADQKREIQEFSNQTAKEIIDQLGHYSAVWSFTKTYDPDEIYESVIGQATSFIELKAKSYGQEIIKNFYMPTDINTDIILSRIANAIRDEALKIVTQSNVLNQGVLGSFIGDKLREKLNQKIKTELSNISALYLVSETIPITYSSSECPVCLENFNVHDHKRLYLQCGHALCVYCLRNWYNTKKDETSCPLCRKPINIRDYAYDLFPPSAPLLKV